MSKDKLRCFICGKDCLVRLTARVDGPQGEAVVCLDCVEKNKKVLVGKVDNQRGSDEELRKAAQESA